MKEAKNMIAMMMEKDIKPNVVTYSCLMNGYCLVSQVNKAKIIFSIMARKGVAPGAHSYSIMINGFCKIKMVDEAINLFEEMHCKQIFPNVVTYIPLLMVCANQGESHMLWSLSMKCMIEVNHLI